MHNAKMAIFYFSGTGNTELIAKQFAEALSSSGQDVDLFRMEDILKGSRSVKYESYGLIGIGHPVLGFGASDLLNVLWNSYLIVMEPPLSCSRQPLLHTILIMELRILFCVLCVKRGLHPSTIPFWRCHAIFILNMMTD